MPAIVPRCYFARRATATAHKGGRGKYAIGAGRRVNLIVNVEEMCWPRQNVEQWRQRHARHENGCSNSLTLRTAHQYIIIKTHIKSRTENKNQAISRTFVLDEMS